MDLWQSLRTISGIFKVVAVLEGVIGGLIGLTSLLASFSSSFFNPGPAPASAFLTLVWILLSALALYEAGEVILVLIAIEENTRPCP